jgi:hypothetical protein
MTSLTERYAAQIRGTLSCFDRIVLTGTLPGICYARGMEAYLRAHGIRLIDYPHFAQPLRDEVHQTIRQLAQEAGIQIEVIRSPKAFRKEARVQQVLKERPVTSGIVHIFSAMEACSCYEYRYDKPSGRSFLSGRTAKCQHYYVYLLHEEFGLCYLRIPTWCPFRLQFYCNGHAWLAHRLQEEGIGFTLLDNAFVNIADWERAQALADAFPIERLHRELDRLAALYCPVVRHFETTYHWSLMQVEYATDVVFKRQEDLTPVYDALVHTAIHAVKPDDVATFLGRKLHANFEDEVGNDFHTRIKGTRIKHHMGPVSLKLYDKYGLILRIETTVNDVSFFSHYRTVEHRDGTKESQQAPMKKTLYSLAPLREVTLAANRRYLDFLSQLPDPTAGLKKVEQLSEPVVYNERTYRGFNLFDDDDLTLLRALLRGEFAISGLRNAWLRCVLPDRTGAQVSRLLKRLHLHGLLKKVAHSYKYHLTALGKEVCLAALKLRELVVIPSLANLLPNEPNLCAS